MASELEWQHNFLVRIINCSLGSMMVTIVHCVQDCGPTKMLELIVYLSGANW